jgi:flagellar FliJ protein
VAKFVFKLDPLLEHRRRIERDHRVKVAAIEAERSALESELRSLSEQAERSREGLRGALSPGGGGPAGGVALAAAARWQAAATMSMDVRSRAVAVKLAGVLKRLEAARALLVEASKARRAVERLRERRYEAYVHEAARAELAELDDISTMRAASPANGG